MDQRLDQVIMRAFSERVDAPPFTAQQVAPFRTFVDEFLLAQGIVPDWSIHPDQNLSLHILQKLSACMDDPDKALFPIFDFWNPVGDS